MKNILVICAHPDDEVFGLGGTIAKYSKEGVKVDVIIFSYGEQSHPWLRKHFVIETRIKEQKAASEILGTRSTTFFGLREGYFQEDAKKRRVQSRLAAIIKKHKPKKIFTHSIDDPHPDHKMVHLSSLDALQKSKHKCDVYTFDVWNPINFMKRKKPKLYVDISKTFQKKLGALRCFRSQKASLISLLWSVYIRAITNGIENRTKFAEVFYKIK
jgi:LmbE family N-acetylglucosaminyl deacetylase